MQQEETNPPTAEQIALATDIEAHAQAIFDGRIVDHGWKEWMKKLQKLSALCKASGSSCADLKPDGGAVDRLIKAIEDEDNRKICHREIFASIMPTLKWRH